MSASRPQRLQRSLLRYQHVFVFFAPVLFVLGVVLAAPTQGSGTAYWLEYWWLFFFFLLGATTVNTIGISGSALFVPFLIFVFPLLAGHQLEPETLVKVGLISESFGLSSSAVAFVQYGLVDRRLGLSLVAGAVPFVVAGALLSFLVPEPVFHGLLGLALMAAAYLMMTADLDHEEPAESDAAAADGGEAVTPDDGTAGAEEAPGQGVTADGGTDDLPDDSGKLGPAGVGRDDDGVVTRVDRTGSTYSYTWSGYLERFANYGIGGTFQGLAGFGVGELGIISMLRTEVPVRVAIGTNHIVVAITAVLASLVHVFGGGLVGGHSINLASTPWNMVVFTVPATVLGGQIAPYVSNALDTSTIKRGVAALFFVISVALFGMAGLGAF